VAAARREHHYRDSDDAEEKRREPGRERLPHSCVYGRSSPADSRNGFNRPSAR
jgi:hypothetical protein